MEFYHLISTIPQILDDNKFMRAKLYLTFGIKNNKNSHVGKYQLIT